MLTSSIVLGVQWIWVTDFDEFRGAWFLGRLARPFVT